MSDDVIKIGSAEALGLQPLTPRIAADMGLRPALSERELLRELAGMDGVSAEMSAALIRHDVKSVDALADLATDDLDGWVERNSIGDFVAEHDGYFHGLDVPRSESERLILAARTIVGTISDMPADAVLRIGSAESLGFRRLTEEAAADLGLRGRPGA